MGSNIVVDALNRAISDPPDLRLLRKIERSFAWSPAAARRYIASSLLEVGLAPVEARGVEVASQYTINSFMQVLINLGYDPNDLNMICGESATNPTMSRSPEWTTAAMRLALWADAQMAP